MKSCGNKLCAEEEKAAREQRCKRKEHDESPKTCCKFTKSTTGGEAMTAGPFWMKVRELLIIFIIYYSG